MSFLGLRWLELQAQLMAGVSFGRPLTPEARDATRETMDQLFDEMSLDEACQVVLEGTNAVTRYARTVERTALRPVMVALAGGRS